MSDVLRSRKVPGESWAAVSTLRQETLIYCGFKLQADFGESTQGCKFWEGSGQSSGERFGQVLTEGS